MESNNNRHHQSFVTPVSLPSSFTTPTRHALATNRTPLRACPAVTIPTACAAPTSSSSPPPPSASSHAAPRCSPAAPPHALSETGLGLYGVDAEQLLNDPLERLRAFIKVRASLDPHVETVYDFSGVVHAMIPGEMSRPLFRVDGFSVAVARRTDLGWRLLTREVAIYYDLETGEPLKTWTNSLLSIDGDATIAPTVHDVVHVWNDPVNQELTCDPIRTPIVSHMVSEDLACWSVDVFPRYKSPLPLTAFPHVGGPDVYESGELFSFFANVDDVTSPMHPHVMHPVAMSWSRIGPWLPWMGMRDHPGQLVYHCRGTRVRDGVQGLKPHLRRFVEEQGQEKFFQAPTEFSRPNETSWSYMRKLLNAKGSPRADGRVASPASSFKSVSPPATPPPPSSQTPAAKTAGADVRQQTTREDEKTLLELSSKQLRAFAATKDGNQPIYMAVAGRVFDVSSSPQHYGFGETYQRLTGVDASLALLSGSFKYGNASSRSDGVGVSDGEEEDDVSQVVDLQKLSEEQRSTLKSWVHFFNERYEQVGVLCDYDGERV